MVEPDWENARWRKSSRSTGGTSCVECASGDGVIGVRDSKNPDSAVLVFKAPAWRDFLNGIKAGEFDPR